MPFLLQAASLAEVALRVPPLFVVDELLKLSLGLPALPASELPPLILNASDVSQDGATAEMYQHLLKPYLLTAVRFLLCCLGVVGALGMFVLKTKHLLVVYMYLTSVCVVLISYWANVTTLKSLGAHTHTHTGSSILEELLSLRFSPLMEPALLLLENYVAQLLMAWAFLFLQGGPKHRYLQVCVSLSFTLPSLLAMLPLPARALMHAPVFAAVLPLALLKVSLWSSALPALRIVAGGYAHARAFVSNFGLSALIETEWLRLNVPSVLRLFWTVRVLEHAAILLLDNYELADEGFKVTALLAAQTLSSAAKSLLVTGCETITAVLGMTSVISFFCRYIGDLFQWILLTDEEEDKNIGTVSAILFYILALQTGLTSLNPEKRFVRLCRNFFLLFTALLHFLHNIVSPMLLSLSASRSPAWHRHVRALGVCAFLVAFPLALLGYLWTHHSLSTWLLAVSAFSVEVIIKVLVSLAVYALFLLDACRDSFWEELDDYVYYIRAFGNSVEFCFGIFLFFNGAWILVFESGGAIRAMMMCIHAYFNIWCEAKAGWSVFMKRRTAVNKIASLPEASPEQLQALDDVCAICYQDMTSAKITKCQHFFHGVCLRKWLYVQDRCPLCHDILYRTDSASPPPHMQDEQAENHILNQPLAIDPDLR